MEKIWIAGAKGHVGSALCDLLDCRHYEILPTDLEEVDITDRESVSNYVRVSRPDVLINCVGFGDIASCEAQPDKAYQVNTVGARNLAVQAQAIGAKLIHLSTDDVFSHHARQPYNEFEIPTPSTIYGKSKLAGERFVQNRCTRHFIVRSSCVYGIGKHFVNTILEAANNPSVTSMEVAENEFASPTSATELAKVIEQLIDNDCLGIYHAVCGGFCSRFEFAQAILKAIHAKDKLTLKPISDSETINYSVLDNMMLRLENFTQPISWQQALKDYIRTTGGNN